MTGPRLQLTVGDPAHVVQRLPELGVSGAVLSDDGVVVFLTEQDDVDHVVLELTCDVDFDVLELLISDT